MYHHTKTKGDLGVAKVNARLVELGYLTLNPNTEHAPFDLVAYKERTFYRVQVKYKAVLNDRINIDLRSCYSSTKKMSAKHADKSEIDIVGVYCPDNDLCYFIKADTMKQHKVLNLLNDLSEYMQIEER